MEWPPIMPFEREYQDACAGKYGSDMVEHLSWISEIASKGDSACELGVGRGESTRALLRHDIEIHSYEIKPQAGCIEWFEEARKLGRNITLHLESSRVARIKPTDFLFLDSYHSYEQVRIELALHSPKTKKYMMFHDTTLFANNDQNEEDLILPGPPPGIWPAIEEFLEDNPQWTLVERRQNNNGMALLERIA